MLSSEKTRYFSAELLDPNLEFQEAAASMLSHISAPQKTMKEQKHWSMPLLGYLGTDVPGLKGMLWLGWKLPISPR